MKVKFLLFFLHLYCISFAQNVSGLVTDNSGVPLAGVSVLVEGKGKGTVTDFDGKFTINAIQGDILIFSFIGLKTQRVTVGSDTTINVVLEEDTTTLDEVVVTAFGIEKDIKTVGYSLQQIDSETIEKSNSTNIFEALQGNVAGLSISTTSGTAGGGTDILLRGVNSLYAGNDNQPLIIVDGLPVNNETISGEVNPSTGSNSTNSAEQFSFSNRGMDINPEDIASVSVLKGASASALYGLRGANGAIIITTKRGKIGKPQFSFVSGLSMKSVEKTPELQSKYREGYSGEARLSMNPDSADGYDHNGTTFYTWGPTYEDDPDNNFFFHNTYDDFFRTGLVLENNFSVNGGSESIRYFASIGHVDESGIVPNTDYSRTTVRLKNNIELSKSLDFEGSIGYTKSGGSRANSGDKSIMSSLSYWSPSVDINDYLLPDGSQKNYAAGIIDNPRYFAETSNLKDDVDRWIASGKLNWDVNDWLNLSYIASIDTYADNRRRYVPDDLDVGDDVGGFIVEEHIKFNAFNSNFIATATKDITDKFRATLLVGNQIDMNDKDYAYVRGEGLRAAGLNNLGNTREIFQRSYNQKRRIVGLFGDLRLEYANRVFFTLTGRNDWASTLPKDNRSFFYPSASASFLFNDLIDEEQKIFSFGKIRASWAEVGKIPPIGVVGRFYYPSDYNGFYISETAGILDLEPEITRTFEIGTDLRFLDNKFRIDYTYYRNTSEKQIFPLNVAPSSGISRLWTNAGKVENIGHEVLLSADILHNEKINWTATVNWFTNEGEVLSLPEDISSIVFADSGFAGVVAQVNVGDSPGTLYGYTWRYENGQRYIGANGRPEIEVDERKKVGNAFPDWTGTFQNTFSYKNLSLSFLLEYKKGGDLYDAGQRNSIRNGILQITADQRNETVVLDGVMDDGNGGYTTNTIETLIDQNYFRDSFAYNRASEILVQDASWLKLRNISLTYNLPGTVIEPLNLDTVSLSVGAGNIILWTPFDGFDPEGNQYSAGSNTYGFTGLNIPLAQTYNFTLKVGF
ncbi:SusC/RagA family TonB-linked outer membrane protein [Abyssalbus ytuae]|uniref:SusC/RagA family TonB-linked outer membrane protein n=1 Tax=Abyssalbus ytuae TaxID=2926907 RepID=A0A9E6ZPB4_9FLAO|nr:SusC/RagA family TonB-linked outer membrane protein [Abyssalbus ytuae]UOB18060.1 SusC/RagA family TonB-linked outer membrane protein [Abyssalbus ytuae]